jgi:hypothetical protein
MPLPNDQPMLLPHQLNYSTYNNSAYVRGLYDTETMPSGVFDRVVSEVIQPSDVEKLSKAKEEAVYWFRIGESAYFKVVDTVNRIAAEGLFRFDLNPDTGSPYSSMSEYYPYLLEELKASSHFHKLSERLVRSLVMVDRVFVQGQGITREQILDDGVSMYTTLAEALDYDHKTGEIRETPKVGKLGRDEALQILQTAREGNWREQDLRAALDERRGVERRTVHVTWRRCGSAGYRVSRIDVFEGGKSLLLKDDDGSWLDDILPPDIAEWITKKLGATYTVVQGGEL